MDDEYDQIDSNTFETFKCTILTPWTFLPTFLRDEICNDVRACEFANVLCETTLNRFGQSSFQPRARGEGYFSGDLEAFKDRFLKTSDYLVFVLSDEFSTLLDEIYPRLLVFLTRFRHLNDRIILIYLGDAVSQSKVDACILTHQPVIFRGTLDKPWVNDRSTWWKLFTILSRPHTHRSTPDRFFADNRALSDRLSLLSDTIPELVTSFASFHTPQLPRHRQPDNSTDVVNSVFLTTDVASWICSPGENVRVSRDFTSKSSVQYQNPHGRYYLTNDLRLRSDASLELDRPSASEFCQDSESTASRSLGGLDDGHCHAVGQSNSLQHPTEHTVSRLKRSRPAYLKDDHELNTLPSDFSQRTSTSYLDLDRESFYLPPLRLEGVYGEESLLGDQTDMMFESRGALSSQISSESDSQEELRHYGGLLTDVRHGQTLKVILATASGRTSTPNIDVNVTNYMSAEELDKTELNSIKQDLIEPYGSSRWSKQLSSSSKHNPNPTQDLLSTTCNSDVELTSQRPGVPQESIKVDLNFKTKATSSNGDEFVEQSNGVILQSFPPNMLDNVPDGNQFSTADNAAATTAEELSQFEAKLQDEQTAKSSGLATGAGFSDCVQMDQVLLESLAHEGVESDQMNSVLSSQLEVDKSRFLQSKPSISERSLTEKPFSDFPRIDDVDTLNLLPIEFQPVLSEKELYATKNNPTVYEESYSRKLPTIGKDLSSIYQMEDNKVAEGDIIPSKILDAYPTIVNYTVESGDESDMITVGHGSDIRSLPSDRLDRSEQESLPPHQTIFTSRVSIFTPVLRSPPFVEVMSDITDETRDNKSILPDIDGTLLGQGAPMPLMQTLPSSMTIVAVNDHQMSRLLPQEERGEQSISRIVDPDRFYFYRHGRSLSEGITLSNIKPLPMEVLEEVQYGSMAQESEAGSNDAMENPSGAETEKEKIVSAFVIATREQKEVNVAADLMEDLHQDVIPRETMSYQMGANQTIKPILSQENAGKGHQNLLLTSESEQDHSGGDYSPSLLMTQSTFSLHATNEPLDISQTRTDQDAPEVSIQSQNVQSVRSKPTESQRMSLNHHTPRNSVDEALNGDGNRDRSFVELKSDSRVASQTPVNSTPRFWHTGPSRVIQRICFAIGNGDEPAPFILSGSGWRAAVRHPLGACVLLVGTCLISPLVPRVTRLIRNLIETEQLVFLSPVFWLDRPVMYILSQSLLQRPPSLGSRPAQASPGDGPITMVSFSSRPWALAFTGTER